MSLVIKAFPAPMAGQIPLKAGRARVPILRETDFQSATISHSSHLEHIIIDDAFERAELKSKYVIHSPPSNRQGLPPVSSPYRWPSAVYQAGSRIY